MLDNALLGGLNKRLFAVFFFRFNGFVEL